LRLQWPTKTIALTISNVIREKRLQISIKENCGGEGYGECKHSAQSESSFHSDSCSNFANFASLFNETPDRGRAFNSPAVWFMLQGEAYSWHCQKGV
jgi:hypothetical protein